MPPEPGHPLLRIVWRAPCLCADAVKARAANSCTLSHSNWVQVHGGRALPRTAGQAHRVFDPQQFNYGHEVLHAMQLLCTVCIGFLMFKRIPICVVVMAAALDDASSQPVLRFSPDARRTGMEPGIPAYNVLFEAMKKHGLFSQGPSGVETSVCQFEIRLAAVHA